MAEWVLKYADTRGEIHQQVANAGSEQEVRERYSQQGFLVYSIKPRGGALAATGMFGRRKKVNLEKFLIFNQQFVTLIRAGLPILKGLDLLADRLTDPNLGQYIKSVRDEVKNGTLLSEAFRQQQVFPRIYTTSVMAGEKSGSLVEVLDRYITYQKLALGVKKKVLVSLMYPALLSVVGSGAIALIVLFVIPRFAALLSDLGQELPAATRLLLALSAGVRSYGLVLGAASLALAVIAARAIGERQAAWHGWLLRLPVVGALRLGLASARTSRTLGALLGSGTPALAALEIAREAAGDAAVATRIAAARGRVAEGQGLTAALEATGALTSSALQLAAVGEGSGRLPTLLAKAAELDDAEAERRLKTLVSLLEPGMILLFAGLVAFVAAALLQAVYALRP